ncbi:hypothetical protein LAG90_01020 [Marinilongibacter aquaticus]|uniref:hypothetical protein n=1 Tax=Marinilongibacter aquaticus TaxID=2975157 RepID=UPI0021BD0087|nr:hypothetical protein [Marinilongibacter aquaticus]UBM59238.1 hypothetical protein LAG90_01020 [Marinilongibacter aquaticus]
MKHALLSLFLFTPLILKAQNIKIYAGPLASSFGNAKRIPLLEKSLRTYTYGVGFDYLEKERYSLTSQLAYVKIGGRDDNPDNQPQFQKAQESHGYLSLSTLFRLNLLHYKKTSTFVGLGPFLNVSTQKTHAFESAMYKGYYYFSKAYWGGLAEIGLVSQIDRINVGFSGNFQYSFSSAAYSTISPNSSAHILPLLHKSISFPVIISLGYRLK